MQLKWVLACATLLLSAVAWAQAPIVIKFSHVVAPDTPKGKAADLFRQLAEQRSGGKVRVEVYPNSQLYKDGEELEALQLGSVQMLAPSLSKFGPLGLPEFELFDLPYIFPDRAVLGRVVGGAIGRDLLQRLETKGIVGLAFWDNGFKVMSANRPLHAVTDFRGLKMRIKSSKVLDAQMRALGALPQVLAFSEVYQALQTGVVDGTENTPPNLYTQKMYEVQKYVALSNHGYDGYAVIVNKKFWDALPADIRTTLEGAMRDATEFENRLSLQDNEDSIAKVKASGKSTVYALTADEQAAWRRALLPVHRAMENRIGKALIEAVYREAAALGYKAGP
ncbi:MAG TPA: TRAP transporter substrate-binding protein [Casimicrobiaceae bacterium]|jgi:C4-dicarboxylate-binding protein DctP|nr:TRAP transporter substrate-binding protein [Casimicrobiaceae bacterium]